MNSSNSKIQASNITFESFCKQVLNDFKLAWISRYCSIIGRREVLNGKAKFGIFGDGKELAQIAMSHVFKAGDWRSGYYRDQTFMFATGMSNPLNFFAQLYGDCDLVRNPDNGGRSMNNHYGTRLFDIQGELKNLTTQKNSASDISCTAGQMPRLIGLAYASKLFRENPQLFVYNRLSNHGNEVAFGTIGDASTSEGHFWEAINAAGVLQIPLVMAVWDDGYGISVPKKLQTTKESISKILSGFEKTPHSNGIHIISVKGWDYPGLCKAFENAVSKARVHHIPVLVHVEELTQPLGHSSSGSHERYKSAEQLNWEKDHDCILKMHKWIIENGIATEEILEKIESEAHEIVRQARRESFELHRAHFNVYLSELEQIVHKKNCACPNGKDAKLDEILAQVLTLPEPSKKDILGAAKKILRYVCNTCTAPKNLRSQLSEWIAEKMEENNKIYSSHLYSEKNSPLNVVREVLRFSQTPELVNGSEIIRRNFDVLLDLDPRIVIFGEDSGKLGDVNQGLVGLQEKYGEWRVTDTGIRETTIVGQGIGLAMRGLRPVAEIQYLDYLMYAIQTLSDDLATLSWRTVGGQSAPLIIRTRGHRLEGIWHSGSPMGILINSLRGLHICVPRDMTRAAGFYNTLLRGNDPAVVIEPLNGYRIKESVPANLGHFTLPLGEPEILVEGSDITVVTYGACVRIALETLPQLKEFGISAEIIDVQTLLPFDLNHIISASVKKTGRVLFFDEDVPGGATGYMMHKVVEEQKAFYFLDQPPATLTGRAHRPAYGTDGDYFSNPNSEDLFEKIYAMMHEFNPDKFPAIY